MELDSSPFSQNPQMCNNKWCTNNTINIPTSGTLLKCGGLEELTVKRDRYGGISGRGVTPCPMGYIQKGNNLIPFNKQTSKAFMLLQSDRPGYLPPQGNIRSLMRIGNEYRN